MKDIISNSITIKEKTLRFSNNSYSNIFLFNENQCFSIDLNNQTLDLQEFINSNELILPHEATFNIGTKIEGELLQFSSQTNTHTVCSDLRIISIRHTYLLNIYIDATKKTFIEIKRVYSGEEDVNFFDIYMGEHTLNISVESLKQEVVKEAGIIIFSKDCNITPVQCHSTEGNKAHFKVDLNTLISNTSNTFRGNLIFNGNIFPISVNKDALFKDSIPSTSGVIHSLLVNSRDGLLNISVSNFIKFRPTLTNISLNNNCFSLRGMIDSTLTLGDHELFEVEFNIFNEDSSMDIVAEYDDCSFKIELSNEDLLDIKRVFSKNFKLKVTIKSKTCALYPISEDNSLSEVICFNTDSYKQSGFEYEKITDDLTQLLTATCKDSSGSNVDIILENGLNQPANLFIGNSISIKEIPYIRAKKDTIQIKFRSVRNLPEDIFTLELASQSKKLKAAKIKKIGKKTFIATFKHSDEASLKGDDVFSFLDEIISKGMQIKIEIEDKVYIQEISDINELSVFKSTKEFISNTRKYKRLCSLAYRRIFLHLPINKKRVLFESFLGRNISGNPKYIYQHLVESGLDEEFELVWILNDTSETIEGKHEVVKRKSLKYYYFMATSGYWVFNSRQAKNIKKRDGVKYIQTWHGTPLKRLAGDMDSVNMGNTKSISKYKTEFFSESSKWDYLLAQNDFSKETLSRAFNFNKEIIEGYPANDILYTKNNKSDIEQLKNKLGLPTNKKVILYAPTWRDNQFFKKGHYKFDIQLELDKMQEKLGDEYVVILKTHYLIANSIDTDNYDGFVFDFSKGYDIQELYLVSDTLITDYSSVMFDFANLKRPIIFFTYDLEDYRDNLRGFYFDFEEIAPGPIALTTSDVIDSILDTNLQSEYATKYENFYNTFCHIDNGHSSKNVIDTVFNLKK